MPPKKPPRKEKPLPVKEWSIAMKCEYRKTVTVKGRTEDEAYHAAKAGDFGECHGSGEELINWEVIGNPEANE